MLRVIKIQIPRSMIINSLNDITRPRMKIYALVSIVVFILFTTSLFLLQRNFLNETYNEKDISRFERVLHEKETWIEGEFGQLREIFKEDDPEIVLNDRSEDYQNLAEEKGIYIFYFEKEALIYWSDHTVPIRPIWNRRLNRPFIELQSASYVSVSSKTDNGILLGLILN